MIVSLGSISFTRVEGNVEQSTKVRLENPEDADAIRGIAATKLDAVFADLKTRTQVDQAIAALQLARETLPEN